MIHSPVQSIYDLIENQYNLIITTEENPLVTSVGVTDVIVLGNNPRRLSFALINLSANTLYVRPMAPASATAGIVLVSGGGSLTMDWTTDGLLPSLEWHALATGAGSAIYIMSVIIR